MRRPTDQMRGEQGGVLIEVLVSSILLVVTAVGVFSAFDAGTRSTAEQRHRAQAHGVAQADVARLRTMRISALSNLHQAKVVTIDGIPYTVESAAEFQTDSTGTASCEKGTAKADYIQIRSTVTWPTMGERAPVVAQSLVAPPNGSISAKTGSLAVQIVDAANVGTEGIGLSGTGAGTFSGPTGPNGCAIFGNLPNGAYTLSVAAPSLVDRDGKAPAAQSTSVVAEGTNTLVLQYDEPGEVVAKFKAWVGGTLVPVSADTIVAFNSGMKVARVFGTPATAKEKVEARPLFPFTSPYSVYAGTCASNDPGLAGKPTSADAIAEAIVSPGGVTEVEVEMPALYLTVWSGTKASNPGSLVSGATVKISDTKCSVASPFVRSYTTNAAGTLSNPALPFSTYNVCVTSGGRRVKVSSLKVPADPEKLSSGTSLSVYLTGSESTSSSTCP